MQLEKGITGLGSRQLGYYTLTLALCWILAIATSLTWNLTHHEYETKKLATHVARSHYQKDLLYRRWSAGHGGVYAPISAQTPPNPYLKKVQDRELVITSPSGQDLTLINPAYMTRQVYELATEEHGIQAHMSSLRPLRPGNKADAWETKALMAFADGEEEVSTLVTMNGSEYLRLMRPFLTEESCLQCHDHQGFKVGDVLGGISIKVPTAPFKEMAAEHIRIMWLGHISLTFFGLAGIIVGFLSLKKGLTERDQAEEKLSKAYDEIEQRVEERTQELAESNALLTKEIKNRQQLSKEKTDLEIQLRQAQKMEAIGTLSGGIAHDFNNILTPILGYSELLNKEITPDSPGSDHLQNILHAAKRARDLVRQILTFSRQTEKEDLHPILIVPIIKEALKLIRASIPTTIEIKQHLDPHCGAVLADPTHIHQVVINLCTNSYHAMRETGGVLSINLSPTEIRPDDYLTELDLKPGPYLKMEIGDSGHGMDQPILEKIFEPYFTTKKPGEGTGMGLSVVHGIIKGMAGHITATSESGHGTTFQILLPCLPELQNKATTTDQKILPRGQETILLVDDEIEIVKLGRQMLETLGYHVVSFVDSQAALEAFAESPAAFDLVITDMAMPHTTGTELAQKLMNIRPTIPIVLCSGYSALVNEQSAKEIGIREYMIKPFTHKKLAEMVRKILEQSST